MVNDEAHATVVCTLSDGKDNNNILVYIRIYVISMIHTSYIMYFCFDLSSCSRAYRYKPICTCRGLQDSSDEEAAGLRNNVVFLKYVRLGEVNLKICSRGFTWFPDLTDMKVRGTMTSLTSKSSSSGLLLLLCRDSGVTKRPALRTFSPRPRVHQPRSIGMSDRQRPLQPPKHVL